jgi:hypothetical protein
VEAAEIRPAPRRPGLNMQHLQSYEGEAALLVSTPRSDAVLLSQSVRQAIVDGGKSAGGAAGPPIMANRVATPGVAASQLRGLQLGLARLGFEGGSCLTSEQGAVEAEGGDNGLPGHSGVWTTSVPRAAAPAAAGPDAAIQVAQLKQRLKYLQAEVPPNPQPPVIFLFSEGSISKPRSSPGRS